ncbi:MAG: hypothetical protein NT147_01385, partial [Candidatus Aminicenantes bacterium]|nr:hypothetical protein [Candidatus Aminicenantes bacterium]
YRAGGLSWTLGQISQFIEALMSIDKYPRPLATISAIIALTFLALPVARGLPQPPLRPVQDTATVPRTQLQTLLAKAAEYCRKLEGAAFEFGCREEVAESVNPSLDIGPNSPPAKSGGTPFAGPTISFGWTNKIKRTFVYDLQCGRAGGVVRETRTLLEENGKKKVVTDAEPETPIVAFGTALLGPVGLFSERFQPGYEFSVAGEENIGTTKVLVVEAKPRSGTGAGPISNLYGKAWIDPATGDVLRLEWSESRVGRLDVFAKRGRLYKRKPRLVIRSEYGVEKNGIRFPSRVSVEEAYLEDPGKAIVRSKAEAVYKDFKFSAVSFEVRD